MNKQDIINAKFDSKEEIIESLFLYSKRNCFDDNFNKTVLENNPHIHLSMNELLESMLDYDEIFFRKIENFANRIEKDRFVRDKAKNLSKIINNSVSQTKLKETVAKTLSMMLSEVSKIRYELSFSQDDLRDLIDLFNDEEHLKTEFNEIILRMIKNIKDFTYEVANFELVTFRTIAEYYVSYYVENNPERVKELKQKIEDYIVMPDKELKKIADKIIEEISEAKPLELNEEESHIDDLWSQAMTSLQNSPIDDNSTVLDNFNNKKYDTLFDDEWSPEEEKETDNVYHKTRMLYPKYFLDKEEELDQDEFFDKIFFKTVSTHFHRKGLKHPNTVSFFSGYLTECFNQYVEKKLAGKSPEDSIHKYMITIDFFLFLAHSLLTGNEEFANELRILCFDYIQNNEEVARNYSLFMNEYSDEEHCLIFNPTQMYDNVIVMSVLFELDSDKGIRRAIRRLLLKYYKKIDDSLEVYNKKERKLYYDENEHSDMTYHETVHEYAVAFLFNYFKDPVYIAPFSAFILEFEDVFLLNYNFYNTSSATIDSIGTDIELDNKLFQKANHYYQDIDKILEEAQNVDLSYLEDEFSVKYTTLFLVAVQKAYMYDCFMDYEYMIRQNQKRLAMFLTFTDENVAFGFNDWDIEDKIEFLWENSLSISFLKDIFNSSVFLPKIQDITNDQYTCTLENKIEQQEETINEKEIEISSLQSQIRVMSQTIDHEKKESTKDEEKAYYNEISKLNKELKEKDKTIRKLEENQEELFKLRQLLFELQNNEGVINGAEEIHYEEKLLEITNEKKIVCIGGHIRLLAALKDKYSRMSFMEVVNSVSDRVVRNADYIFFFYNFMSHGTYVKVMNLISHNKTVKWDYISAKNIDIVEKEMYEKIKRFKK